MRSVEKHSKALYHKGEEKRGVFPENAGFWGVKGMYYSKDGDQVSIEEFFMPFGGKLSKSNRWMRLSGIMPWKQIDNIYVKSMSLREKNGITA